MLFPSHFSKLQIIGYTIRQHVHKECSSRTFQIKFQFFFVGESSWYPIVKFTKIQKWETCLHVFLCSHFRKYRPIIMKFQCNILNYIDFALYIKSSRQVVTKIVTISFVDFTKKHKRNLNVFLKYTFVFHNRLG